MTWVGMRSRLGLGFQSLGPKYIYNKERTQRGVHHHFLGRLLLTIDPECYCISEITFSPASFHSFIPPEKSMTRAYFALSNAFAAVSDSSHSSLLQ